jgi:hypothetical protein
MCGVGLLFPVEVFTILGVEGDGRGMRDEIGESRSERWRLTFGGVSNSC